MVKDGTTTTNYSFDAWGRRRSATDWTSYNTGATSLFADRGYTGHEHLADFGLINMNGRLYDPVVGRFLNPDNFVQQPGSAQSFNRYSYCLNNPLKYSDPDGNNPFLAQLGVSWMGNYVVGFMNNVLNNKMSIKEAFHNTPIGFGVNVSPSNGSFSNPQVDAYTTASYASTLSNNIDQLWTDHLTYGNYDGYGNNYSKNIPSLEGISIDLLHMAGSNTFDFGFRGLTISLLKDRRDYIGITLTLNSASKYGEFTLIGLNTVSGFRNDGSNLNIDDTFGFGSTQSYGVYFGSYSTSTNSSFINGKASDEYTINTYGLSSGFDGAYARYENYTYGFSFPSLPALMKKWYK